MQTRKIPAPTGKKVRSDGVGQSKPRSVVVLAKGRDSELFRIILDKCRITPQTSPAEIAAAICRDEVVVNLQIRGAEIHRCARTAITVHLTLKTSAGYSRFEGTPAQMLAAFRPLADFGYLDGQKKPGVSEDKPRKGRSHLKRQEVQGVPRLAGHRAIRLCTRSFRRAGWNSVVGRDARGRRAAIAQS
jgi:hypothetical protein